jgi:peptidoglycan hydrolase-like protein with peptidoglycan-binding domain
MMKVNDARKFITTTTKGIMTMEIKHFGKILLIAAPLALTPLSLSAQTSADPTRRQSDTPKPQSGGDAAVTGQSQSQIRDSGGQQAPTSSAGMAASSTEITKLQQALKDRGQDPGAINGVMTPQTQQALRNFQAQQGLNATGTLDAQSRTALGLGLGAGSNASGTSAGDKTGTAAGTPIDPTLTPGQEVVPGSTSRGTSAPTTGLGTQTPPSGLSTQPPSSGVGTGSGLSGSDTAGGLGAPGSGVSGGAGGAGGGAAGGAGGAGGGK